MEELLKRYQEIFTVSSLQGRQIPDIMYYTHSTPFIAVGLYLFTMFIFPKLFSKGLPESIIKPMMAIWNLTLSVMSFCILVGVGIPYYFRFQEHGFMTLFCDKNRFDFFILNSSVTWEPSTLHWWGILFVLSKYFELFDTVLRLLKKPQGNIEFLHWWHHTTVLLFTWYTIVYHLTLGWFFGWINALVHTFMYWYYFLMSIGQKPKWAMSLTLLQIVQMFIGIGLNGYWAYLYFLGNDCGCDEPQFMVIMAFIMYGSYLILFVLFFINKYMKKDEKKEDKKKSQ
jgi:hypothetical protein